jgi:hypothetical protein
MSDQASAIASPSSPKGRVGLISAVVGLPHFMMEVTMAGRALLDARLRATASADEYRQHPRS